MRIEKTNILSPELERTINALTALSHDEGQKQTPYLNGELNFDKQLPFIYLAYDESDALAGAIALFLPGKEAEVFACVHPDMRRKGVYTALINEVERDLKGKCTSLLFMTEKCASSAREVRQKLYPDATLNRTEYTMERPRGALQAHDVNGLIFERVTFDSLKRLVELSNAAFDDYEDDENSEIFRALCDNPDREAYIGVLNGADAGAVCVAFEYESGVRQTYVHGVCVAQNARRQGIGRALIAKALAISFADETVTRARLDVETNNPNALKLYTDCGFKELFALEYWEKKI